MHVNVLWEGKEKKVCKLCLHHFKQETEAQSVYTFLVKEYTFVHSIFLIMIIVFGK